MLLLLNRIIVD